ncbi:MAG TPA: type II toxin-antitoxin system prevent-host-death family antitoxin [Polyangiales bacterium]|nr:type II toxin-antitoxin system prevent-host-death family antitoxin [Polyangiales bacterium]
MAKIFNVHEAKTRLSELLQLAQAGEEVVIAKAGKAYARLVPIFAEGDRQPGILKGQLEGDVLEGLDDEELDDWS